jgi:hypothetical protein
VLKCCLLFKTVNHPLFKSVQDIYTPAIFITFLILIQRCCLYNFLVERLWISVLFLSDRVVDVSMF